MHTFPTAAYHPQFQQATTHPSSPWATHPQEPKIERYPSSLFTPQELHYKRQMNLVGVDEFGNEFVYVRKN